MKKRNRQNDSFDEDKVNEGLDEDFDQETDLENVDTEHKGNCTESETDCHCEKNCNCGENCDCRKDEDIEKKCESTKEDNCGENCKCQNRLEQKNYLDDLMRLQAEFDNYRKRMQSALSVARQDGFIDAIEQFVPALDSFKMATDMITDKNTLMGIKFIEKGILDTLNKMGVEEIDATGKFNPELHQAIDTDDSADVESGTITKVAYRGFTYKGKVIRYAQVVVKK